MIREEVEHAAKHAGVLAFTTVPCGRFCYPTFPRRTQRLGEGTSLPQGYTVSKTQSTGSTLNLLLLKPQLLSAHVFFMGILMGCSECSLWSQHSWVQIPKLLGTETQTLS